MWTKSITIKYNKKAYEVVVTFTGENDDNKPVLEIRSMVNELFMIQEIIFNTREELYEFIEHYNFDYAYAFFLRESENNNVFETPHPLGSMGASPKKYSNR